MSSAVTSRFQYNIPLHGLATTPFLSLLARWTTIDQGMNLPGVPVEFVVKVYGTTEFLARACNYVAIEIFIRV